MACSSIWHDPILFPIVAEHCSHGSLQLYGASCRRALQNAYQVVNWKAIDMGQWPFSIRELREAKKQDEYQRALGEYRLAMEEYEREHPLNMDGTGPYTWEAILNMPVPPVHLGFNSDSDLHIGLPGFKTFGDEARTRRDDDVSDKELISLLARLPAARVVELKVSSPRLTDVGVATALQSQCPSLQTLLLGSGHDGGQLTGSCFSALPMLRSLELYNISFASFTPLLVGEKMEELCIYSKARQILEASLAAIVNLRQLQVLKLACKDVSTRLPEISLLRIFAACTKLQVIDIYSVANTSSRLLACIVAHNQSLTDFTGFSYDLDEGSDAIQQFKAHYSSARVFIDWIDPISGW